MVTLLHGSDLQLGKPYRPAVGEAFRQLAGELAPELVVVAGDLTQRAKPREFAAVRAYLDAMAQHTVVVTPGNHDVPLYRFWERLLDPYRNWRRWISEELDTVTRVAGVTCVALNSAAPRRAVVAGHLGEDQIEDAREAFREAPADDFRVVVTHHHFIPTPDRQGGRPLDGGPRILEAFESMGVDLVLGGHVHQTHLGSSRTLVPGEGPGIPLVASGTAASSRGRGVESGENSVNVVRLSSEQVEVQVYRYQAGAGVFEPAANYVFSRHTAAREARAWVGGAA